MTIFVYVTRHRQFGRIRHIYTTPQKPLFIAYKKPPRPKIRRGRKFLLTRKAYVTPALPATFIAYKRVPFLRPKIRRWRRLIIRRKIYTTPALPATFIAYKRPPRPKVKRWRRFLPRKLFAFLPPPVIAPLVWARPRFLRPKVRRGRRFVIRHPYTTPLLPATFVAYRPFPRAKIKRKRINLQRFKLHFYQFTGIPPVVNKIADWLVRARRRGRR